MTEDLMPLALIRHGPTEWNAEGRIQGTIDTPLSGAGRARVAGWSIPAELAGFRWFVSPRLRARETARLLGLDPLVEPSLAEMDWGEWEGRRLAELRAELGEVMAENERRGLDFRPPGGESPRDLRRRLGPWLAAVGAGRQPTGAVAHGGVIRAVYALASGWDLTGKPPVKLRDGCAQVFGLDARGTPRIDRLNVPLEGA